MRVPFVAVVFMAVVSIACGGGTPSTPPVQPQYEPEIVNNTDAFSFQLTGVENGGGTLSYTWENTGTTAKVNRSSSISAGTVTIRLLDNDGVEVLLQPLTVNGDVFSAVGTPGSWTIVVDFAQASGTIHFLVDKQ